MLPQLGKKRTKKRRVRFAGIGQAATLLGVTRIHLYRVLTGERDGRDGLRQRALLLMAKQQGAAK